MAKDDVKKEPSDLPKTHEDGFSNVKNDLENSEWIINSEKRPFDLNETEALSLIQRLEKGPNEKARKFIKDSLSFYDEMKEKERKYKERKL